MLENSDVVRFSTDTLPEALRLQAWRETVDGLAISMDIANVSEGPFRVEAARRQLPNAGLVNIVSTPYEMSSDGKSDNDDILFIIFHRGGTVARQGARELEVGTGEAMLWSNELTGGTKFHSDTDRLLFVFPRRILAPMVSEIDASMMTALPRDTAALKLLSSYGAGLLDETSILSPELKARSATHLHDLVALALGARRDAAEIAKGRGVRIARLKALKADIEENLTSRDLSLENLARRHRISPRYVRALFDSEGTSFTDCVLGLRLLRAHSALCSRSQGDKKISTVAYESGFGDLSYFNLAFRRRFGLTPSDARALALKD